MGGLGCSCDRERPVSPEAKGGGSRRWRNELLIAKATRCGRRRASPPVVFSVGREPAAWRRPSRDGRGRPSRLLAFPVVVGILPPPRPATGAHFLAGAGRRRHSPRFRAATSPPDPAPLWDDAGHGGGALRT